MIKSVIRFDSQGLGHCLYTESIALASIGSLAITRASSIEFSHASQQWEVRNSEDQVLYCHPSRAQCLEWEEQYFNR